MQLGNIRKTASRMARASLRSALIGRPVKRRFPPSFGRRPLFVTSDSALQFLLKPGFGDIGEGLMLLADRFIRPSSNAWDIGANIGIFAVAAAHRSSTGTVLALEPDLDLVGVLRRSASLPENRDLQIKVVPAAASVRAGVAVLELSGKGSASNRLTDAVAVQGLTSRSTVAVPTVTLDGLLETEAPPSFVKIDVEGAEHLVLGGAGKLLSAERPILAVEVWGENSEYVTALFRDNRYALFDGAKLRSGLQEVDTCPYDTIAIPQERVAEERAALNGPLASTTPPR